MNSHYEDFSGLMENVKMGTSRKIPVKLMQLSWAISEIIRQPEELGQLHLRASLLSDAFERIANEEM